MRQISDVVIERQVARARCAAAAVGPQADGVRVKPLAGEKGEEVLLREEGNIRWIRENKYILMNECTLTASQTDGPVMPCKQPGPQHANSWCNEARVGRR